MRARMETGDLLMLLAAKLDAADYEVPGERLAVELDDLAAGPAPDGGGPAPDRMARIMAAVAAAEGEVG